MCGHGQFQDLLVKRICKMDFDRGLAWVHQNTGITSFYYRPGCGFLLKYANYSPSQLKIESEKLIEPWFNLVPRATAAFTRFLASDLDAKLLRQLYALRLKYGLFDSSPEEYKVSDPSSIYFLATFGGDIQGMAQYNPLLNQLQQLLVLPAYRNVGIGRTLVNRIMEEASTRHQTSLCVHAWVSSKTFFQKLGFESIDNEYLNNGILCQKLVKNLTQLSFSSSSSSISNSENNLQSNKKRKADDL